MHYPGLLYSFGFDSFEIVLDCVCLNDNYIKYNEEN